MVLAHFSIVGALRAISRAIQICFNICSSSTGLEMAAPQSGGTFKLVNGVSAYFFVDRDYGFSNPCNALSVT